VDSTCPPRRDEGKEKEKRESLTYTKKGLTAVHIGTILVYRGGGEKRRRNRRRRGSLFF